MYWAKILDSTLECRYFQFWSRMIMKRFAPLIFGMALAIGTNALGEDSVGSIDTSYIRPPAVAGSFYPGSPAELAKMLAQFFHAAPKPQIAGKPLALIAPHAGYVYSGAIAARAYKFLEGEEYQTVIIIAPSHTAYFKGVSAFGGKAYSTPLGEVPIDKELTRKIIAAGGPIMLSDIGHLISSGQSEHALEVQLPFLQATLGKFNLVALIMGDQDPLTCTALGEAIARAVGKRDDVLIVASSDLSHFHDQATASKLDSIIARDIEQYDYQQLSDDLQSQKTEACGGGPIVAALIAAKEIGADSVKLTGFGDSGETSGDRSSVVGYLSAVVSQSGQTEKIHVIDEAEDNPEIKSADSGKGYLEPASTAEFGLSESDKKLLLSIARQSIASRLEGKEFVLPANMPDAVCAPLGAFVTLQEGDELRGCIGTFHPNSPLYQVVTEMARQAAFSDYRFQPLTQNEFNRVDIEISVLTPMKRIYNSDSVVVGRDGLYIRRGNCSGVLLPQVPVEQGWDRTTFLDHTCLKAGLPSSSWKSDQTELYVFQAEIFGER
jgi:MEMO1 family protein